MVIAIIAIFANAKHLMIIAKYKIIIIIIISYFLPIAKDVTNTETTVMYGLRVTQTA
jgi:hypothetical protein